MALKPIKPKTRTPLPEDTRGTNWANITSQAVSNTAANKGKVAVPYTPEQKLMNRAAGDLVNKYTAAYHAGTSPSYLNYDQAKGVVRDVAGMDAAAANAPVVRNTGIGGAGSGGGGGGGGGGRAVADPHAQEQMNYLVSLLAGKNYTASPLTAQRDALNNLRSTVSTASAADQASATGAYNNLDTYLQGHQTNPYADVKLNQAQVAPDYNPYLESQGVQGLNPVTQNPDTSYAAFQNVLALLGANQQSDQQSRLAESQMARTYSGQQIGAMDNAYLANITGQESGIAQQEAQQQQGLDAEKRQALLQLATLISQGAKAPDLAALGLA